MREVKAEEEEGSFAALEDDGEKRTATAKSTGEGQVRHRR
jgi:hypothetical protein